MPFLKTADGWVHLKMGKPRNRRCSYCRALVTGQRGFLCDFVLPSGKTCDRFMCDRCTQKCVLDPGKDYCRVHRVTSPPLFPVTLFEPEGESP